MKTLINFVTQSMGDNIAFSIYADIYQKKYGGQVYVKTIWNNLFYSENPNVFFVNTSYEDYKKISILNFKKGRCKK
jgi:hypothetical protein